MILEVSNKMYHDQNTGVRCQYSKGSDTQYEALLDTKEPKKFFAIFVRPRVVVGKYLEIFSMGRLVYQPFESKLGNVPASSPKDNLWSENVDGKRSVSCDFFVAGRYPILMLLCCGSLKNTMEPFRIKIIMFIAVKIINVLARSFPTSLQDGRFSNSSNFSNIWCFFAGFFAESNSNVLVEWVFACFRHYKFLTQTDHYATAIASPWAIAFARCPILKIVSFLEYLVFFPADFCKKQF